MLGMVSNYNPDEHTILGGELEAYIQRINKETGKKMFLVRYNKIGSFVIAEWLAKPRDVFVDVMNLGKSLGTFNREKANELRHRLFAPVTCRETSVGIAEEESRYLHERQDENEEETERLAKISRGE